MKRSSRDILVIVGVLIVVAVGYFLFKEPSPLSKQEAAVEFEHPDVEGMDRNAMPSLANFPTDYESLVQLGNQLMDQGNFPIAAEAYKRALAIDPRDPNVRTDFGACLHGMGLQRRAIEEFHRVLTEHPEHAIANFNLGIVFYNTKTLDSARYYWKEYLRIEPDGQAAAQAKQYLETIGG
ncbi:MAG: tetratricopeptide repeat protein [Candidatus Zixiibacteriota bacterium]